MRVPVLAAVGVLFLAACSRDLAYPQAPQRGKVVGTLDTQGHIPVANEPVSLVEADGARLGVLTAADGTFVFTDVRPGTHSLSLDLPGFAPLVRPGITVTHGATTDAGVLQPTWLANTPEQAVVQGKVVVAGGGDPNGGQVAFYLKLSGSQQQLVALAAIGVSGEFVQRVPPGTYDLKASHPLFVTADLPDVSVGAGAAVDLSSSPISMALNPATLTGTVTQERDGLPPVPAVAALVTLADGNTTTTDSAGNFSLGGLGAGIKPVRVQLAGYHDAVDGHLVTLEPGKTTALGTVNLLLDRGAISGTVALADHQTALDVTVALSGVPYNTQVTPDAANPWQGTFLIPNVPVGSYEVSATKARYSRAVAGSVAVNASSTTSVGTLTLALLQGDFVITGDLNIPGYTRTPRVTLDLSRFSGAASYRASEDSTFAGVAFSPYGATRYPFVLGGAQGTHTVYAQYRDGAGTVSSTSSSQIVLDSLAPVNPSLVINAGSPFTNVPNPLFLTLQVDNPVPSGVDAVSALAQVLLNETGATLDGGNPFDGGAVLAASTSVPYQRDLAFVRASSGDGTQPVYAQFVDQAGNVSAAVRATIGVDTVVPTGGITIADGAAATAHGYTSSALVTVNASVVSPKPNGDAILMRLANSQAALATAVYQPVSATSSWFLDPSLHGLRTVYAQLRDQAGNVSGQLSASVTFDVTPPNPATASLVGASTTRGPSVTLALTAADDSLLSPTQAVTASESAFFQGAGTVGPQAFPGTSQLSFPLSTGDGPKTIYVRFRDAAGNDAVTSVGVTLKATPPSGGLTLLGALADGTPSSTLTATPNVTVQLSTAGGATGYLLGNETLTTCPASGYASLGASTLPWTLTGAASPRVVALCLTDAAGNTAGPYTATIALDTAPPSGCVLSLTGRKVDGSAAPAGKTASALVTGTLAGCSTTPTEVVLSSTPVTCTPLASLAWQPSTAALAVQLPGPDGLNTISGCVRDAARNPTSFTAGSITLQTRAPGPPSLVLDNGAATVNAAQVTARGGLVASARGVAPGAVDWSLSETGTFSSYSPYATNPINFTFAGSGARVLYAVFRDDVGNTSPAATASITFDTQAPDGGALAIITPTGNAYTSTPSVTLAITAPADAERLVVASAASSAGCVPSDLAAAVAQPFAPTLTFVLPGGDGLKRVCLQLLDAAGNAGGILSAAVTLDTVAPSAPVLVTPEAILDGGSLGAGAVAVSIVSGSAADLNFARFERVGGDATSWTTASTNPAATTFTFTLTANPAYEQGVPNLLQVRAVDLAGNAGPAGSVVFTVDASRPLAATTNANWVSNANRQASLRWRPSSSPDVVAYRVYYGGASGTYNGQFASDGPSPVTVGNVTAATLSGLINASPTYVTVKPVDHAGNEGSAAGEVVLQPNEVALNPIGRISLANGGVALALQESTLYVLELTTGAGYGAALQAIDLSSLVSPIQGGGILTPAPTMPVAGAAQLFPDAIASYQNAAVMGLQVDGNYLYMADGTKVRIFDLAVPLSPNRVVEMDIGYPAHTLQVRGNTLFVGGRDYSGGCVAARAGVSAFDLSKLFDHNAATKPSFPTDQLGRTTNGTCSGNPYEGLLWTRNQIVQHESASATWNITPALNRAAWGNANLQSQVGLKTYSESYADPVQSGNLAYQSAVTGFRVVPLRNVWDGGTYADQTPVATLGVAGGYALDLSGGELFLADTAAGGIRAFNLDTFVSSGTISDMGLVRPASGTATGMVHYGNYLLVLNASSVEVYEAATPRAIRQVAQSTAGSQSHTVSGSFLFSFGSVLDLQGGSPPPTLGAFGAGACYQQAYVDENEVLAGGSQLRVANLENATDREPSTPYDVSQMYTVAMPPNVFATGVATWGNFLVVAEKQTAAPAGTYLEIFDSRNIRGRVAASKLTLGNSVDRFLVTASTGQAEVRMYKGRAIVALEGPSPAVYVVDTRPDFADGPVGLGASAVQATIIPASGDTAPRSAVAQGNYLYFTTGQGLEVVDVSQAFDESPATTVGASPPRTLFSTAAGSVDVHGSYAVVLPRYTGSMQVLDVSIPLSPRVLTATAFNAPYRCWFIDGTCSELRSQVSVHGTRAYATTATGTFIFELN